MVGASCDKRHESTNIKVPRSRSVAAPGVWRAMTHAFHKEFSAPTSDEPLDAGGFSDTIPSCCKVGAFCGRGGGTLDSARFVFTEHEKAFG